LLQTRRAGLRSKPPNCERAYSNTKAACCTTNEFCADTIPQPPLAHRWAMAVYQLIDRLSGDPEAINIWIIERAVPRASPIRLQFQGTRREALAEIARLNAFLKLKTAA
jgi:hypothetical protein